MGREPWDLTVLTGPEVAALSAVLAVLGEPTRLRIVLLLCGGERSVGQLVALLRKPQPTVSHHLSMLRQVRLVTDRRAGKSIFYALHARLTVAGDACELRIGIASGITIRIDTMAASSPDAPA